MSFLSSERIAAINAQIATKEAQLELANEMYERLLAKDQEEYRFDSGEGSQRVRRVKLSEIKAQIDSLEASIERLYRRLNQSGLTKLVLRRQ